MNGEINHQGNSSATPTDAASIMIYYLGNLILFRSFFLAIVGILSLPLTGVAAPAPLPGWKHTGVMAVLTTPDGANLPAGAVVEGFPLLVRLNRDWFDFSQAKPDGADLRFTMEMGEPLPHQIEQWDAAGGTASIWVRVPRIEGN